MKVLITKSDGTPTKSKVHAIQYLAKKGIDKELLIEENGQFFYEDEEVFAEKVPKTEAYAEPTGIEFEHSKPLMGQIEYKPVTWDTPVFVQGEERTKLYIPGTDVVATINGKHPAGQIRPVSSFEIAIGAENFIMSVNLISKIFKVKEVK